MNVVRDPDVAVFEEVEVYQARGEWGSRRPRVRTPSSPSRWIERFFRTLACCEHSRALS
jgi:hypothetical protein